MDKLLNFGIKCLSVLTVAIMITACGGGGGGSSSSDTTAKIKIKIDQDNFRSTDARISVGNSEVEELFLSVTGGKSEDVSRDILPEVNSTGYVSLELILKSDYTFSITATDINGTNLCTGSTTQYLDKDTENVAISCISTQVNDDTDDTDDPVVVVTLTGVAASGLPLQGMVYLKDANGTVVSTVIAADGSYEIPTDGLVPPFLLKAEGIVGTTNKTMYAFTDSDSGTMHINPYVNLAAAAALNVSDMDAVYEAPQTYTENMTYNNLRTSANIITEMFADVFEALGATGVDPLSGVYTADSTGIDGVLDHLDITLSDEGFKVVNKNSGAPVISGQVSTLTSGQSLPEMPTAFVEEIAEYVQQGPAQISEVNDFINDLYFTRSRGDFSNYVTSFSFHNGKTHSATLSEGFGEGTYSAIENFQIYKRSSISDVVVYYYEVKANGERVPQYKWLTKINGTWYIDGNERKFKRRAIVSSIKKINESDEISYKTGLQLYAEDSSSQGIELIVVTGDGLPSDGVRMVKNDYGYLKIYSDDSSSGMYYWMNSTERAAMVSAMQSNGYAEYAFTAYTAKTTNYEPSGSALQTIKQKIYPTVLPLTNTESDIDPHFLSVSGMQSHNISSLSSGGTLNLAYTAGTNNILYGDIKFECEDVSGGYHDTSDDLPIGTTAISVALPTANYSLLQECYAYIYYFDYAFTKMITSWKFITSTSEMSDEALLISTVSNVDINNLLGGNSGYSTVTTDLYLPVSLGSNISLSWSSSNTSAISNSGTVSRPSASSGAIDVTLTATATLNQENYSQDFTFTVLPEDEIYNSARVYAGAIADGIVEIYKTSDMSSPVITTNTSSDSDDVSLIGLFQYPTSSIIPEELYIVMVYGGTAFDANYQGSDPDRGMEQNPDGQTPVVTLNKGNVYAVLSGEDLINGNFSVNVLTDIVYRKISYMISAGMPYQKIVDKIDEYANMLLDGNDIEIDGQINNGDILLFNPYTDIDSTAFSSLSQFSSYMNEIYSNSMNSSYKYLSMMNFSEVHSMTAYDTAHSFIENDIIYVSEYDYGIKILDVSDLASPSYLGGIMEAGDYVVKSVKHGDYLYLADRGEGFISVDISDPASPAKADTFTGDSYSSISDIAIHSNGNYAYVAYSASSSVRIINISDPTNLVDVGTYNTPIAIGELYMDTTNDLLYAADTSGYAGAVIINVSSPESLSLHNGENIFYQDEYNTIYDIAAKDDGTNRAVYIAGQNSIEIFDATNLNTVAFEMNLGNAIAVSLKIDNDMLYVGTNQSEVTVFDISDALSPQKLYELTPDITGTNNISLSDGIIHFNTAYGVQIIEDSGNFASRLGAYTDMGYAFSSIKGTDSRVYGAGYKNNSNYIVVMDSSNPEDITSLSSQAYGDSNTIQSLAYDETYFSDTVFATTWGKTLLFGIKDTETVDPPTLYAPGSGIARLDPIEIVGDENKMIVGNRGSFDVFDISGAPASATLLNTHSLGTSSALLYSVIERNGYVYGAQNYTGLTVSHIDTGFMGGINSSNAYGLAIFEDRYLLVTGYEYGGGMNIYDLDTSPTDPMLVGSINLGLDGDDIIKVSVSDNFAYVYDPYFIHVIDISDVKLPRIIAAIPTTANSVDINEDTVFISHSGGGVTTLPKASVSLPYKTFSMEFLATAQDELSLATILGSNPSSTAIDLDLNLPDSLTSGAYVSWILDDNGYILSNGTLDPPTYQDGDTTVYIYANVSYGNESYILGYELTVLSLPPTDDDLAEEALSMLTIEDILAGNSDGDNILTDMNLPTSISDGISLSWDVGNALSINSSGVVTRPAFGVGNEPVTLSASAWYGGSDVHNRTFDITILAEDAVNINVDVGYGGYIGDYSMYAGEYYLYYYDKVNETMSVDASSSTPNYSGPDVDAGGDFTFIANQNNSVSSGDIFILSVFGGTLQDVDYNGEIDDPVTDNFGALHAILPGDAIGTDGNTVGVNIITDIIFHNVEYMIEAGMTSTEIMAAANAYAQKLITSDINSDYVIDYKDALAINAYSDYGITNIIDGSSTNKTSLSTDYIQAYINKLANHIIIPTDYTAPFNNVQFSIGNSSDVNEFISVKNGYISLISDEAKVSSYEINDGLHSQYVINDVIHDSSPAMITDVADIVVTDSYAALAKQSEPFIHILETFTDSTTPIGNNSIFELGSDFISEKLLADETNNIPYEIYTDTGSLYLNAYNMADPSSPTDMIADLLVAAASTLKDAVIDSSGDYIYVVVDEGYIYPVDISAVRAAGSPSTLTSKKSSYAGSSVYDADIKDSTHLYVATDSGVEVFDLSTLPSAAATGSIAISSASDIRNLEVASGYLYAFNYDLYAPQKYCIDTPLSPSLEKSMTDRKLTSSVVDMEYGYDGILYVASSTELVAYNPDITQTSYYGETFSNGKYVRDVAVDGAKAYVAVNDTALNVYDITDIKNISVASGGTPDTPDSGTYDGYLVDVYGSHAVVMTADSLLRYTTSNLADSVKVSPADTTVYTDMYIDSTGDIYASGAQMTMPVDVVLIEPIIDIASVATMDSTVDRIIPGASTVTMEALIKATNFVFYSDKTDTSINYVGNLPAGDMTGVATDPTGIGDLGMINDTILLLDSNNSNLELYSYNSSTGDATQITSLSVSDDVKKVYADESNSYIYITHSAGVSVVYWDGGSTLEYSAFLPSAGNTMNVDADNDYLYIASGLGGLHVVPLIKGDYVIPDNGRDPS